MCGAPGMILAGLMTILTSEAQRLDACNCYAALQQALQGVSSQVSKQCKFEQDTPAVVPVMCAPYWHKFILSFSNLGVPCLPGY